jgi:serine/threonine protein kinase
LLSVQIGKGAFATVNRAYERTTGDVVAVKMIAKRTFAAQIGKENQGVKKEVDILERLQHVSCLPHFYPGKFRGFRPVVGVSHANTAQSPTLYSTSLVSRIILMCTS